jgi:hypothetical protein
MTSPPMAIPRLDVLIGGEVLGRAARVAGPHDGPEEHGRGGRGARGGGRGPFRRRVGAVSQAEHQRAARDGEQGRRGREAAPRARPPDIAPSHGW